MLDAQTKSKIDSARDILVGKVPDPKSQVEQITIALIYKFMDDMDRQSEELNGKASFFTGDFKKYRWAQLLDKRYSGHERLLLYAEGLEKMNENKNIPQLFRDIFRGVFLPYRDPETLNLFLKEINAFTYEHSERLGDAFEYLLSVLGTQGDAGQFRTPRHIIDFIVAVVDPKKSETVLDPACGTAGFLISAFKHIMNCGLRNVDSGLGNGKIQNQQSKIPNPLTPDERARLMSNFRGYDIAPDMVRLSRVNLYLHGFPNPVIHEYDTLTSEERWDERCDVIMANPPFMSPKGGIRPHNRFSIKAKRSEVLFVDYIAEHLNPGGRAGIIVPEGIIFQSQNAYKQLRKMLVENYLWAVVSLPAGVFNPYAGVKTSILFLDRNLAKRTDDVLFVKVENDGFDLGAQRRPVEGSQLAEAQGVIFDFGMQIGDLKKKGFANQQSKITNLKSVASLAVKKSRILENGDINLSGDRYRVAAERHSGKWPMVKLGQVCEFIRGVTYDKADESSVPTTVAVLRANNIDLASHALNLTDIRYLRDGVKLPPEKILKRGDIFICTASGSKEHLGKVAFVSEDITFYFGGFMGCVRCSDAALPKFVFHTMTSPSYDDFIQGLTAGVNINNLRGSDLLSFEIPLPSLDEQERIVAELDGYRKVIEGARQIIANYKPTIRIDPEWPNGKLGPCTSLVSSGVTPLGGKENYLNDGVLFIRSQNVLRGTCDFSDAAFISVAMHKDMSRTDVRAQDVLLNITGASIGRCAVYNEQRQANVNQHVCIIRLKPEMVNSDFLCTLINTEAFQESIMRIQSGASRQALNFQQIRDFAIPLPPLDVQRQIVKELEAERKLVEANRELILRMEAKIKAKLAEVWGEN